MTLLQIRQIILPTNCHYVRMVAFLFFTLPIGLTLEADPGVTAHHHSILIINSYHSEFQWTRDQVDGFVREIKQQYPDAQFFSEFLDAKRIESTVYHRSFAKMLYDKYNGTEFSAVYTTDDIALSFAQSFSERVWDHNTPIIASGVNSPQLLNTDLHPYTRGIVETQGGLTAPITILNQNPEVRQIVIIADQTEVGMEIGDEVERAFRETTNLPIVRNPRASWAETLGFLDKFDSGTLILLALYTVDGQGNYMDPEIVANGITSHAAGPVYVFNELYINNENVVGGIINQGTKHGKAAGKLALMALDGLPLDHIPTYIPCPPVWVFNHSALEKFGIDPKLLPEGSQVNGIPQNILQQYLRILLIILIGLVAQSLLIIYLLFNIRKRHVITKELANREAQLRLLMENSPLAISISDKDGKIIFLNKKYKELTGYDISDLVTLDHLVTVIMPDPEYRAEILGRVAEGERIATIRGTTPEPVEYVAHVKNGENVEVEMYHAEAAGMMFRIINDVSERKRVIRELREATHKAKAANEAKSRFLANVSHEIRTPMNGVLGMVQLLRETDISEDQRDYIDTIRDSCDMLLTAINDILDLSKIEADRMSMEPEPVILREFLNSVAGITGPTIEKKGLEFICDAEPSLPQCIRCDPHRLKQVIVNLLVNASKFTDEGHVELHVRGNGNPGESCRIHFDISDTGIGIEEKDQKRIFEPFIQADSSHTRKHGGTGLGLAICQRLVRMMGGEITLRSKPGNGSTFSFDIQTDVLEPVSTGPDVPACLDGSMYEQHPMKILVAEDNVVNQKVIKMMLGKMGYHADIVTNGQDAVKKAALHHYDVILMDIQMPIMDGLEATQKIRNCDSIRDKPQIIALTAHALGDDVQKCLDAGMNAHLTKPIKVPLLHNALMTAYKNRFDKRTTAVQGGHWPENEHA